MWVDSFREFGQKLLAESKCPGMAVGVARRGELVCFESLGYRNREQQLPYTLDTINGLGSIGKSFTAVAILQLQEQGKLSVHDPVVRYLPRFRTPDPEATKAITLHHFLTHTSGLPGLPFLMWALGPSIKADPDMEGTPLRKMVETTPPIDTYEQLLAAMAEQPYQLIGRPGELMNYSNEGFALLGAIVEQVSGKPYATYITDHILRSAGMTRSNTDSAAAQRDADAATRYDERPKDGGKEVFPSPLWWQDASFHGAGSVHNSTVRDMLRYLEIFRTGGVVEGVRVLSEASVKAMTHPHVAMPPFNHYGYGMMVRDYKGTRLVGHGGNIKGVATNMWCVPELGMTTVVLSNLIVAPAGRVSMAAVHGEMGIPVDTDPNSFTDYDCPAEMLERYTGTYPSAEGIGNPIIAAVENGKLVLKRDDETDVLRPVGKHTFTLTMGTTEMPIAFLTDEQDEPFAIFMGVRARRKAKAAAQ